MRSLRRNQDRIAFIEQHQTASAVREPNRGNKEVDGLYKAGCWPSGRLIGLNQRGSGVMQTPLHFFNRTNSTGRTPERRHHRPCR